MEISLSLETAVDGGRSRAQASETCIAGGGGQLFCGALQSRYQSSTWTGLPPDPISTLVSARGVRAMMVWEEEH